MLLFIHSRCFAFDLGMKVAPPSEQKNTIKYTGALYSPAIFNTLNKEEKASTHFESLNVSIPIFRGEQNGISIATGFQMLDFYPDTVVPDLYNIQVGTTFTHLFKEKQLLSLNINYGSASDKPFKSASVNTINSTLLYSFPSGTEGTWLLLLNYSNNRPILNNIPLPGVAYTYSASKDFKGTFGLPFAYVYWQFVENWSLNFFTVVPWVVKTSVARTFFGFLQLYSGFDFSQMTFLQYGRESSKERLYYDEKKAFLGIKSPLSKFLFADLEAGYAFDREVFPAATYTFSPRSSTKIDSSWYGKISLTSVF